MKKEYRNYSPSFKQKAVDLFSTKDHVNQVWMSESP